MPPTGDLLADVTYLAGAQSHERGAFYAALQDWSKPYRELVFDLYDSIVPAPNSAAAIASLPAPWL